MNTTFCDTKEYFTWDRCGTGDICVDKNDFCKRYATYLIALYMPENGVDENYETTLECLKHYIEEIEMNKKEKPMQIEPKIIKAKYVGTIARPGLCIDIY